MGGSKNKNKDITETSASPSEDSVSSINPTPSSSESSINPSPTTSVSTNDVLLQLLQQQQQQFMLQQQQMAQILASMQGNPSTPIIPINSSPKAQVQSPDKLKLDVTLREAQEWKSKWNDYATLTDLHKLPQPKQFASLRMCLNDEVLRVLDHTLGVKADSTLPVEDIIHKIITHIKDQRNESLRRLEFTNCKQHQGETFDKFWVRLKQIANDIDLCKGDNCVDNQLKHAILVGLRDKDTVQHLLNLKSNTSLSDVLSFVRSCNSPWDTLI